MFSLHGKLMTMSEPLSGTPSPSSSGPSGGERSGTVSGAGSLVRRRVPVPWGVTEQMSVFPPRVELEQTRSGGSAGSSVGVRKTCRPTTSLFVDVRASPVGLLWRCSPAYPGPRSSKEAPGRPEPSEEPARPSPHCSDS